MGEDGGALNTNYAKTMEIGDKSKVIGVIEFNSGINSAERNNIRLFLTLLRH